MKIFDYKVRKSRVCVINDEHRGHAFFANIFATTKKFSKPLCLFIWGPGGVFDKKKVENLVTLSFYTVLMFCVSQPNLFGKTVRESKQNETKK